jgi:hypothetical protein
MYVMARTPSLTLLFAISALCGTLLAACDPASTAPATASAARPTLDQSPNVVRVVSPSVFGIFDEETQLLAVFGLPADPTQWEGCGGTAPGELFTVKLAGLKSGVLKVVGKDADVGIQVFRTSGEREGEFGLEGVAPFVCETAPFASGTGRAIFTGNDLGGNSTRTEVINISLTGTLTSLETSERLHLTATNKFMADHRNGEFRLVRLDGRVDLHPIGGR